MPKNNYADERLYRCLGAVISQRRKYLGLSQSELSAMAEIDRSFLSSVERGKRNPSFGVVARIAYAMNMTYARLVSSCEKMCQSE